MFLSILYAAELRNPEKGLENIYTVGNRYFIVIPRACNQQGCIQINTEDDYIIHKYHDNKK